MTADDRVTFLRGYWEQFSVFNVFDFTGHTQLGLRGKQGEEQ